MEIRGRRAALTVCLALLALTGSCASWYRMKLPSQGRAWLELRSDHFIVDTDVGEEDARAMVDELERRRQALIDTAWHGAKFPPFTTRVVVLSDTDELQEFAPDGILGFWERDLAGEKQIIFAAERGRGVYGFDGLEVATHELVHDLASRYFARQPRWVAEGLAKFLETMEIDAKEGRAVIGKPDVPDIRIAALVVWGTIPLSRPWYEQVGRLFDPQSPFIDEELAGRLVFYLINTEPKAFGQFLDALYRGDDAGAAWDACFPTYAGEEGKKRLAEHLVDYFSAHEVKYRMLSAPSAPYTGEVAMRKMSEPEVRVLRAELLVLGVHGRNDDEANRARAKADVDAALAIDPTFAPALELRVALLDDRAETLAVARAAARANPNDWRAWALVDQAMGEEATATEEAERLAALQTAARLEPGSAWVMQRLARSLVRSGRAGEAVDLARKSLDLDPDSAPALDTAAMVASAQGKCPAALELSRMAVERLPHPPAKEEKRDAAAPHEARWRRETREMRARLAGYETQCGAPAPAR